MVFKIFGEEAPPPTRYKFLLKTCTRLLLLVCSIRHVHFHDRNWTCNNSQFAKTHEYTIYSATPRNIHAFTRLNLCTVYTTSKCTFVIHIWQQTTIKLATSVHIDDFCMTEYILLSGVIVFKIQSVLHTKCIINSNWLCPEHWHLSQHQ